MIHQTSPFRHLVVKACLATFLVAALLGVSLPDGRAQSNTLGSQKTPRRVLLLFSESRDLPGNVSMEQTVRAEILRHFNRVEFYIESLDTGHFPSVQHYQLFGDYIQGKYAGQELDLVVVFLGRDFDTTREMVATCLPNVPAVFVVVSNLETPNLPEIRQFTALFQRFDVPGTLRFICQLQPEIKRVVVVGGTSPSDRALLAEIAETARSIGGVTFEYWADRPPAQVYGAARKLPPDTAILLSTMQRDSAGAPVNTAQIARALAPVASVPVYVMSGGSIGNGTVGGMVVDFDELGRRAGELAVLTLRGKPAGEIPLELRSNGVPIVDARALRRWHLKASRLPADCAVRFQPQSLWRDHWRPILFFGAGFFAQAVTIAALLIQRRRQERAEAEILRQRAELAHVSRVSMMGQLASALTHELNQPLGAILRNAEAAEVYLQAERPNLTELRAILTDIRRDDKRAGDVIDRMRSLFKRQRLTSSAIDLRDLAEDTVAMARPDAEKRRVKLKLEIAPHLPPAQGDRVHIQQVLLNLILNGMDAMNDIPKSRRSLVVGVQKTRNDNLQVSVSDCGAGIDPDHAVHLFEPFFTTKANGMGMGLAISKTIIEAHGGDIWVASRGAEGTTFTFLLPPAGVDRIRFGDLPAAL